MVNNFVHIFYGQSVVKKEQQIPKVAFSNGKLFKQSEEIFVSADEFVDFEAEFTKYRSNFHYNLLSENEQLIYKAFEYAMEKSYSNILVDSKLIDKDKTLVKILDYFSLDTPFLEQNLKYELGNFTTSYPVEIIDLYDAIVEFKGYYITVNNFTKELYNKKKLALEQAQKIISTLDSNLNQVQKAEQLFLYVAKNTEYLDYDDGLLHSYLYDGIVQHKTHCDGFTNSYSLLLTLAGIENFEKTSSGTKEKNGHTWNFVKLGDNWYNVDSVGDSTIPKKASSMGAGFYFCFADILQKHIPDYSEIYPKSEQSLYMNIDGYFKESNATEFLETAKSGFRKNNKEWTLIVLEDFQKNIIDPQFQKIANYFNLDICHFVIELADEKTAILICKDSLF